MKKIYFIRHAKAKKDFFNDYERELNPQGKDDAKFMGKRLKNHGVKVDAIFASAALRAKMTAKIISNELDFNKKIKFDKTLYSANSNSILYFINQISDEFEKIFIIAHNPVITEICEILSDSSIGNIPTCGVFCIEFDNEKFADIKPHCGKVLFFDYPKKEHK